MSRIQEKVAMACQLQTGATSRNELHGVLQRFLFPDMCLVLNGQPGVSVAAYSMGQFPVIYHQTHLFLPIRIPVTVGISSGSFLLVVSWIFW